MIKREYLELVAAAPESDGLGGSTQEYTRSKLVPAHVSNSSSLADITQYGLKEETLLHAVTNEELVDGATIRYRFGGKLFKIVKQVKSGNEYFSTLREVYN